MNTAVPFPEVDTPTGGQLYNLGVNIRPCEVTLRLKYDHQKSSPIFLKMCVVIQEYASSGCVGSTLFCGWLESQPNLIILWEKSAALGVSYTLYDYRFNNNFNNENLINQLSVSEKIIFDSNLILSENNSNQNAKTSNFCDSSITSKKQLNNVENEINIVNDCSFQQQQQLYINLLPIDYKDVLEALLLNMNVHLIDDEDFDTSGTLNNLRESFDELGELYDIALENKSLKWRNMDKTLLNELKASWKEALSLVEEESLDGELPVEVWIPAMWLHVVGCPNSVRTHRELVYLVFKHFFVLENFEFSSAVAALQKAGFRKLIATFICECFCKNFYSFEQCLTDLAEPISWNSYLLRSKDDGLLHYTYLKKKSLHENEYEIAPSKLLPRLKVVGTINPSLEKKIDPFPLKLKNGLLNWCPMDYARETFQFMKDVFSVDGEIFFGHCCAEQSIIEMCKGGISPFRGYSNKSSCGHGVYFFKMDKESLSCEFDSLCGSTLVTGKVAEQFQSFLYALSRVFSDGLKCDFLSPAVLLFRMKSVDEIQAVDARKELLPIVSSSSSQKCSFRENPNHNSVINNNDNNKNNNISSNIDDNNNNNNDNNNINNDNNNNNIIIHNNYNNINNNIIINNIIINNTNNNIIINNINNNIKDNNCNNNKNSNNKNNDNNNNNNYNNNNNNKWVCSCNRATNIFNKNDDVVKLKTENPLCALDVLNALDLMPVFDGDENYFEKKNAFALVAGVVDYDAIQYGAFESSVVDASFPHLLFPIVTHQSWKSKKYFEKWKTLVNKPFESFRRHWLLFDSNGNFLHSENYTVKNDKKMKHWNKVVSETASEFVFVSQESLTLLIEKSVSITAVFVCPELYPRTVDDAAEGEKNKFAEDYEDPRIYTEALVEGSSFGNESKHAYWILRQQCLISNKYK
jgi:hypothetical protein